MLQGRGHERPVAKHPWAAQRNDRVPASIIDVQGEFGFSQTGLLDPRGSTGSLKKPGVSDIFT